MTSVRTGSLSFERFESILPPDRHARVLEAAERSRRVIGRREREHLQEWVDPWSAREGHHDGVRLAAGTPMQSRELVRRRRPDSLGT
jgi:hypothetical protein